MARIDLRVRAWAWLTRRQASVATMTEEQVRAAQSRPMPDSALTNWIFGVRPAGTMVSERVIPGPDGNEIPVRIYRPLNPAPGPRPLIVYFHGGGFVFGALRMGDWICGSVAAGVGAVVMSVDYRLAPAHRFPAAVEDCYAALTWAAKNAADLGAADAGTGGPLGVMGESAGGNLSAVMTLLARDRGGPAISHQALLYPVTDMTENGSRTASARANTDMPFLSTADTAAFRNLYFGPGAGLGSTGLGSTGLGSEDGPGPDGVLADPQLLADPKASPLLAASHAGLPPALIQVAEHDPLHDDGTAYAAALRAAGVPVRLTEYVGQPHGFLNFPGLCRGAEQALSELIAEQRSSLA